MNLLQALRLRKQNINQTISFIGSGGKTTALFLLAKQLHTNVIVTTTTRLAAWQTTLADHHMVANSIEDIQNIPNEGVVLITGEVIGEKATSIEKNILIQLHKYCKSQN